MSLESIDHDVNNHQDINLKNDTDTRAKMCLSKNVDIVFGLDSITQTKKWHMQFQNLLFMEAFS